MFRSFVNEAVDTPSDGVLVQGGTFSFDGPDRYIFDFVRQFEVVDGGGEHDRFEQLHCEFQFEPTAALRELGSFTERWFADDGTPVEVFLDAIRGRAEFTATLECSPVAAKAEQEAV